MSAETKPNHKRHRGLNYFHPDPKDKGMCLIALAGISKIAQSKSIIHIGFFIGAMFLFLDSGTATSQCPAAASCAPLPEEIFISISASIKGAQNVCSRIDPTRTNAYAAATDRLVGDDSEAFQRALQSSYFPAAITAIEIELSAMPKEKLAAKCLALIEK